MSSEKWIWWSRSLTVSVLYQVAWVVLTAFMVLGKKPGIINEIAENPQRYEFGYKSLSQHGDQWRAETGDGKGGVIGSYGYVDESGNRREVKYVADEKGFRAKVNTNEPGMEYRYNPASVILRTPQGNITDKDTKNPYNSAGSRNIRVEYSQPNIKFFISPGNVIVRSKTKTSKDGLKETEILDFYTIYSFSEPKRSVVPRGETQSPWFPIEVSNKK